MVMTRHVKESIKTALAMFIVAGWDKPYWAGLPVAEGINWKSWQEEVFA